MKLTYLGTAAAEGVLYDEFVPVAAADGFIVAYDGMELDI